MKPSKTAYNLYRKPAKRAAKKRPAKRGDGGNPMIDKLLQLKYRINDAAVLEDGWSDDMSSDKSYTQGLINNIREGNNPSKIQLEECNKIWRKYA